MVNYTAIITKDKGTYVGQCLEVPEAITEASTLDELLVNLKDAISLIIEVKKEDMKIKYTGQKVFRRKLQIG